MEELMDLLPDEEQELAALHWMNRRAIWDSTVNVDKEPLNWLGLAVANEICFDVEEKSNKKFIGTPYYQLSLGLSLRRSGERGDWFKPDRQLQALKPPLYFEEDVDQGKWLFGLTLEHNTLRHKKSADFAVSFGLTAAVRLEPGMHMPNLGGTFKNVLNISAIEVYDLWQKRGIFSGLLEGIEDWLTATRSGCSAVYVENISNEHLKAALSRRRGWAIPGHSHLSCMAYLAPRTLCDSAQNTASSATETCKPLCSDDSKAFVYGTEGRAVL
jgi:hypothetical protein